MSGPTEAGAIPDKWGGAAMTTTVETFHSAIRMLVAERFAASGKSWEDAVADPDLELTREDFEKIEDDLLATGDRFEMSAVSRCTRAGQVPGRGGRAEHGPPTDEQGRLIVGAGDNVFRARPTSPARPLRLRRRARDGPPRRRRAGGHDRGDRRLRRHADRADHRGLRRRHLPGRLRPLAPGHPRPRVRRARA